MHSDHHEAYQPKRVLAVGAHPDDIDFGAAATMALWAKQGAEVYYLIVTDGSKGTSDRDLTSEELIKMRRYEQRAAVKTLGAKDVHFLSYVDGELEISRGLKQDLVRAIREIRPDTVVTMDPTVVYTTNPGSINHPDHRAVGQATLDAVYPMARDYLEFPELLDEGLEPHKVSHVFLITFEKHDCVIDVSETFDLKLAALGKHSSQISDINATFDTIRHWASELGRSVGCEYAEGFMRIDID